MCIRDRYQRRVHGDSKYQTMLKFFAAYTIVLVVCAAQNPTIDYFTGMHASFGLSLNPAMIPYLSPRALDLTSLSNAYQTIQYKAQPFRDFAINSFKQIFLSFADSRAILKNDLNFTRVLNYTMTVLWDANQFHIRADQYAKETGKDIYLSLIHI
eukprot:TRINITY_DN12516_c0_g1_i1.p1 TRINITY_DN12516_c0_g1~~TRINITY_DN12516_c0_g1_i1.p1  ORF type:complete len:177 (+),score=54.80 TRINITY_DN12516_c0_g1_i1:69-533(+)